MDESESDYCQSRILAAWAKAEKSAGNLKFRTKDPMLFALCLYVSGEAKTGKLAAQIAGVPESSFYTSKSRKPIKNLEKALIQAFVANTASRALGRILRLSEQNENLNVSMQATVELAKISGLYSATSQNHPNTNGAGGSGVEIIMPEPQAK